MRSSNEYPSCSAVTGAQPRNRLSRLASATRQADPGLAFGVALRPELVADLLLEFPPERPARTGGMGVATATPELLESVLKILRLSENPRDFRVLAPGLEREIHWWLLTGPLGGSVRPIGVADSRICLVGRATRWITERFDQVIRIDDVAAVGYSVGYDSPSRFSREDRRLFGLPPGEDARRLLEDRH